MRLMKNLALTVLISLTLLLLCAVDSHAVTTSAMRIANEAAGEGDDEINDPIEPVNRAIFKFNSYFDQYLFRPVAVGYKDVVPAWGRKRVTNVFYNLTEPVTVVNSVLQGDPKSSFTSTWRFLLNSTVGVAGAFDVAQDFGLEPRQETFGQTLGKWGYTDSAYIVIPFFGPSTIRDGIGQVADFYTNPFYDGIIIDDDTTLIVAGAVNAVDKRSNILPITDDIEKTSLDTYTTYRSYYLQHKNNQIKNGQADNKNMDTMPTN